MNRGAIMDKISGNLEAKRGLAERLMLGTTWDFECYDRDGNLKWAERNRPNKITDEGANALLNIAFGGATQIDPWYVAAVETDTAPAAGMTYATPVFTECEAYSGGARPAYEPAAASAKSITSIANKATFTMTGTKTLYGGALVGGGTDPDVPGDTEGGGVLFCYSRFDSGKAVENTDIFKITVTIGLTT